MSTYKVSLFFVRGNQGWSEQWYATSSQTPQVAAEFLSQPGFVGPYTAMKGTGTTFQAVRVSDVAVPRSNYLVPVERYCESMGGALYGAGDIGQLALLCDLYAGINGRKAFLYRGLAEGLSNFDFNGDALFSAQFQLAWSNWIGFIQGSGLQIRYQLPPASSPNIGMNVPVVSIGANTANNQQSLVTFNPPAGYNWPTTGRVVFHGLPRRQFPGWTGSIPYNVVTQPTVLSVPIVWLPGSTMDTPGNATGKVFQINYAAITSGFYNDFRSRKVGRIFDTARGRRPAVKYRGY